MAEDKTKRAAAGAASAAAVVKEPDPVVESTESLAAAEHEQIARLAYSYWQDRGCPDGSPEEDWFRAEVDLLEQAAKRAA
jgi:hypothetical protein